jgi:acyl dehydratase
MTSELDAKTGDWFDASVIGVEVEIGTFEVTPARVQSYCAALGDTNPLYFDPEIAARSRHGGLIAPVGLLISPQLDQGLDAQVRFGTTMFAAGDRVEIFEVLRPGDRITARQMVKEIYPKTGRSGTMLFVVRRTTYTNQHGRTVATTEFSVVYREV